MKISEIFYKTADTLSSNRFENMCDALQAEFNRASMERERREDVDSYEHSKVAYRAFNKLRNILFSFKPKYAGFDGYWVVVKNTHYAHTSRAKFAVMVNTIEEAQQWRKDVLLKCAVIAENEGL